jgi:hypothetical protein
MTRTSNRDLADWIYLYSVITYLLFAFRDGLTGSIRWFFSLFHLDFLWFIPDLLAFGSVFFFIVYQVFKMRNLAAILFVGAFFFSCGIGILFMNDSIFGLSASIKSFIPIFVGLCFFRRSITEYKWVRVLIMVMFLSSMIGLIVSPYVDFPWFGQTISTFGIERQATKLWWTGGQIRYGGLAGDSTMAAFMTTFTYYLISRYWGFWPNVMMWGPIIWAVQTSTSKTALLTFIGFMGLYLIGYFYRNTAYHLPLLRFFAKCSFLMILIPPVLMITLSGADLGAISPNLMSMQDRIDNTWQMPFVYLSDIFPAGLFFGCGIGCYAYPMDYTSMVNYNVSLDNFYLTTMVMMGYPFVLFVVLQFFAVKQAQDHIKLMLIVLFNFYSFTIQCYGPSFATLMFGYIFSEMFRDKRGVAFIGLKTVYPRSQPVVSSPATRPLRPGMVT